MLPFLRDGENDRFHWFRLITCRSGRAFESGHLPPREPRARRDHTKQQQRWREPTDPARRMLIQSLSRGLFATRAPVPTTLLRHRAFRARYHYRFIHTSNDVSVPEDR